MAPKQTGTKTAKTPYFRYVPENTHIWTPKEPPKMTPDLDP